MNRSRQGRTGRPFAAPQRDATRVTRRDIPRRPRLRPLNFASAVIRDVAATGEPADRILKVRLHEARLAPAEAALVSRAVFTWYRWSGFLERFSPDATGLERALALQEKFSRHPRGFDERTLLARTVPDWVGGELTVTSDWVRTLQEPPRLWLRGRPGKARELAASLPCATAGVVATLPDAVRYEGATDLFRTEAFRAGRFEIQDIASQAVGTVCAPQPGETWWDVCAGEGGKMLHLSDLMANRGLIWATDRSVRRLETLRRRAARAGVFNYRAAAWAEPARLPTRTRFDGLLVDAPCSGLGTWARNPHARWTTTPDDVRELAEVQWSLLSAAAGAAMRTGGRLVYAVCTHTHSETHAIADRFDREAAARGYEALAFNDPFAPEAPPAPRQMWWPQTTQGNGMFIAAWRRNDRK